MISTPLACCLLVAHPGAAFSSSSYLRDASCPRRVGASRGEVLMFRVPPEGQDRPEILTVADK
jgi:hypothetical protein